MGAPNSLPVNQGLVLSYRAQLVQKATSRIPYTAEGLPVGYYRIDLLPNSPQSAEEEIQALNNAFTDLSFEHGYPTLPDGRPFWTKLEFEPSFAFGTFQIYLEQIEAGPRELHALSENTELHSLASRMMGFQDNELMPKSQLQSLIIEQSVLYSWRVRAKAYDLYKEASYRHLRLRRQMSLENRHYEKASKWLDKLEADVFDQPEFWSNMSAKTAVEFLGKLVGIQRISTGLPMSGPLSQKESPESTTFEMILRQLGVKTNSGQTYENSAQQGKQILDHVLKDPNSTKQLQELVIRVSQARSANLPNPNEEGSANRFKGRNREVHAITSDDLATGLDMSGAPGANLDTTEAEILEERKQP